MFRGIGLLLSWPTCITKNNYRFGIHIRKGKRIFSLRGRVEFYTIHCTFYDIA